MRAAQVNRGEDVYLKMLLEDKLMHADLHPGNLLLDERGAVRRINVVDAGMVAALSDCLLYTSPSPRDRSLSRMPSSA